MWYDHKEDPGAMKRESSFSPISGLPLTSVCTSWLGPRVTWVLINYSYYALQTGGNRCGSDAGASCLPLIYHIQESNYRSHILLSLLCQAIPPILRTMAFLFPKGDTPRRSCGGSLSQTPLSVSQKSSAPR